MGNIKTTTILDVYGKPHKYTCVPFGFRQSTAIFLKLQTGFLASVGPVMAGLVNGATTGDGIDLKDLPKTIGPALSSVPEQILQHGGSDLISEIFGRAHRETGGDMLPLNLECNLDLAYSGGNYAECLRALAWILGVNYLPFLPDGTPDWSGLLMALGLSTLITRDS